MKTFFSILFLLINLTCISQTIQDRERIEKDFKAKGDLDLVLFRLDSIEIKSNYLRENNVSYEILRFKISGIDNDGKIIFHSISWSNKIPTEFKQKITKCNECKSIKIDEVTISWFTGTNTLTLEKIWKIE